MWPNGSGPSNNWSHAHHDVLPCPCLTTPLYISPTLLGVPNWGSFYPNPIHPKVKLSLQAINLTEQIVNKVGYNCTLKEKGDMKAKTDKCDWTLLRSLSHQSLGHRLQCLPWWMHVQLIGWTVLREFLWVNLQYHALLLLWLPQS